MQLQQANVSAKRPAALIGEIIDSTYALQLIQGFRQKFPSEVSSIFIESYIIFNAVKDLPHVSGIRFMYGMESVNDPTSKVILLIPCDTTSDHRPIPNTIVQPQGYLNNRGERVSLKRTWQVLYNHAVHYAGLLPEVKFRKIVRGVFFGIDALKALLQEYTNAHGIHYHFGWDDVTPGIEAQHKAVLHPVHANGTGYGIYMDFGSICPTSCYPPPKPEKPASTPDADNIPFFDLLPHKYSHGDKPSTDDDPATGPLIEMCYYVSPALEEAIAGTGKAAEIYTALYDRELRSCNLLIEEGKYEAARILFEQTMDDLMKTYLLH